MRPIDADALIEFCAERWIPLNVDAVNMQPTIQPEQCGDKSYTLWKESYEELKRRMDELTSCSDIISRQAALNALARTAREKFNLSDEYNHYLAGLMDGELAIKELPTIQPERQIGRWIRRDCGLDVECKCSRCGYKDFVEPRDEYWFKRNYCPNCGAKMGGKPNE